MWLAGEDIVINHWTAEGYQEVGWNGSVILGKEEHVLNQTLSFAGYESTLDGCGLAKAWSEEMVPELFQMAVT